MLCNERFTRTLHLGTDMFQVRVEEVGIAGKAFIHKPKCPKGRREVLDDFRADGNLNGLDGGKQQGFEFLVKVIIIQNLGEMTILLELVCGMVSFHISPIISQAKIADDIQGFSCLTLIFDNQSSLPENADLFRCSYGLLCIFHTLIK